MFCKEKVLLGIAIVALLYLCISVQRFEQTYIEKPRIDPTCYDAFLKGKIAAMSLAWGRLGNIMSGFATLYAYQQEFGFVPLVTNRTNWTLCFYFECNEEFRVLEYILPEYESCRWIDFDPDRNTWMMGASGILNQTLVPSPYLNIGLFPNKIKYFKRHLPRLIARFLMLKEQFQSFAEERIENATFTYRKSRGLHNVILQYVGIHIRRTDYMDHLHNNWKLKLIEQDYFTRAMTFFRTSEKNVVFIVVSDDMKWARENIIPVNGDCFFLGTGKQPTDEVAGISTEIGNDLALLSKMNYSIMTYGTFGTWGALLAASKKVIMPKGYEAVDVVADIIAANLSGWMFL